MENTFAIKAPHGETIQIPTTFVAENDVYGTLKTNADIKKYYEDNGYVVLRGLVPTELCDNARKAFEGEVKPLNLREVNGMKVNFPKDQNELKNQLLMKVETTFPKVFNLLRNW